MGKKKRTSSQVPVARAVVATLPEPFTRFQAWANKQKDGYMLLAALVRVGQIYVALADGVAVPVEECRYAFDLSGALHDIALSHGFVEAATACGEAGAFFQAVLEGRA